MPSHLTQLFRPAAIAFVAATALATAAPAQGAPVVLDHGHVDVLDVGFEDGQLGISIHDESVEPDVERSPFDVKLVAKSESQIQVPAEPEYGFLGTAGANVWVLPEVEDPNLLWPGVSGEEIEPGALVGDTVRLRLLAAVGPGDVSVFTNDAFGTPQVLLDSGDGLPDALPVTAAAHRHYSWSFDRPGHYHLVFDAKGQVAATGEIVRTATVLHFQAKA